MPAVEREIESVAKDAESFVSRNPFFVTTGIPIIIGGIIIGATILYAMLNPPTEGPDYEGVVSHVTYGQRDAGYSLVEGFKYIDTTIITLENGKEFEVDGVYEGFKIGVAYRFWVRGYHLEDYEEIRY